MNCKKCGNVLAEGATFCGNCGEPVVMDNNNNNSLDSQNQTGASFNSLSQNGTVSSAPIENDGGMAVSEPQVINPTPLVSGVDNVNNQTSPASGAVNNLNNQVPPVEGVNDVNNQVPPVNGVNDVNNQIPSVNGATNVVNSPMQGNLNVQQPEIGQTVQQSSNVSGGTVDKKSNSSFKIVIIVLVVVILGLCCFIAFKVLNKDSQSSNAGSNSGIDNSNSTTNTNQGNNVVADGAYDYKDFQFMIPTSYSVESSDSSLQLVDKSSRVVVAIAIHEYFSIDEMTDDVIEGIKKEASSMGYNVKSSDRKSYNGIDWVMIYGDLVQDGVTYNAVEAYASLGEYSLTENFIINAGSKSYEDIFKELSTMYSGATYKGTKNFSASDEKEPILEVTPFEFDSSVFDN